MPRTKPTTNWEEKRSKQFLLLENESHILLEDWGRFVLEESNNIATNWN